jgi:hypothetical protein
MKLAMLLFSAADDCSREGAAIGEGIAWLFTRVAWTIIVVLAIAVTSGVVVGHRKRAIVRGRCPPTGAGRDDTLPQLR